jgi:hypothetical protein
MTRTSLIKVGVPLCASIVLAIWWYSSGNASPSVETTLVSGMTCDDDDLHPCLQPWTGGVRSPLDGM